MRALCRKHTNKPTVASFFFDFPSHRLGLSVSTMTLVSPCARMLAWRSAQRTSPFFACVCNFCVARATPPVAIQKPTGGPWQRQSTVRLAVWRHLLQSHVRCLSFFPQSVCRLEFLFLRRPTKPFGRPRASVGCVLYNEPADAVNHCRRTPRPPNVFYALKKRHRPRWTAAKVQRGNTCG